MAQNDILKRYLDAGLAFTQLTRERAEAIVADLVKAGDIRRKEAEQQIEQLLERSRKNTEDLMGIVRKEVAEQLRAMGLDDLAKRAEEASTPPAADVAATDTTATAGASPQAPPSTVTEPASDVTEQDVPTAAAAGSSDPTPPLADMPAVDMPTKGAPKSGAATKSAPAKTPTKGAPAAATPAPPAKKAPAAKAAKTPEKGSPVNTVNADAKSALKKAAAKKSAPPA